MAPFDRPRGHTFQENQVPATLQAAAGYTALGAEQHSPFRGTSLAAPMPLHAHAAVKPALKRHLWASGKARFDGSSLITPTVTISRARCGITARKARQTQLRATRRLRLAAAAAPGAGAPGRAGGRRCWWGLLSMPACAAWASPKGELADHIDGRKLRGTREQAQAFAKRIAWRARPGHAWARPPLSTP